MVHIVAYVVESLLTIYWWIVIAAAVFSTLSSFGVIDTRNRMVWTIGDFLYRATEPVFRPIRNLLPNLGGIDFSPLIVLLLIQAASMLVARIEFAVYANSLAPLL